MKLDAPLPDCLKHELWEISVELSDALRYDGFVGVFDLPESDSGLRAEEGALTEQAVESAYQRLREVMLASDAAALRRVKV